MNNKSEKNKNLLIYTLKNKNNIFSLLLFSALLIATYFAYIKGLPGVFILDDQLNLSPLEKYTQLDYWDRFWLFLLEGNSGPTGRPISLASFYLNDTTWPSNPEGFTFTNILIHLFNGILVFWFTLKLSTYLKLTSLQQQVFAFISTSLWILHPFQVSTVLYIIQRMTELSALFTLSGLLFYLYGRERLAKHKISGSLLLFMGVGLSLLLSILSKENGILLVAFILAIEFFLLRPFDNIPPKSFKIWLFPTVILPFTFVILYLGERAWQATGFDHRNFTFMQHLLTEPRVIFNYLQHILIPTIQGTGIFHDDFVVSKSLFDPLTTLPAILGILALIALMWALRKKAPLISFAIAWFFAGHLIESTVISLELYFEHRNYLPLLGFIMAVAYYLSRYFVLHQKAVISFVSVTLVIFVFLVSQNAKAWGNPYLLVTQAFKAHPYSERAEEAYLMYMKHIGVPKEKLDKIRDLSLHEITLYSALFDLDEACASGKLTTEILNSALQVIKDKPIHGAASFALMKFVQNCLANQNQVSTSNDIEIFLTEALALHKQKKNANDFFYYVNFLLADLNRKKGNFDKTMSYLESAYKLKPNVELIKRRAGYFTSMGQHRKALEILEDTALIEKKGFRVRLALKIKQKDLDKLKQVVLRKIEQDKLKKLAVHSLD